MKKILLIGEICEDIHIYGHCKRLNPEAPTPILSFESQESSKGMSGNVCANLNSLSKDKLYIEHIRNSQRITKTRFVDKKHGYILLRLDEDATITVIHRDVLSSAIKDISNKKFDAVIISDYDKGFISEPDLQSIAATCHLSGTPSFIDTKKRYSYHFDLFDFIKINNIEYDSNGWRKYDGEGKIIVTQGESGANLFSKHGVHKLFKTIPQQVVNVSGAGDTFLAGLVVSILNGHTLDESIEYANEAAGIAVSKAGVVAVKHEEINEKGFN